MNKAEMLSSISSLHIVLEILSSFLWPKKWNKGIKTEMEKVKLVYSQHDCLHKKIVQNLQKSC